MSTNATFVTPPHTNMMKRLDSCCARSATKNIADISEVNSGRSESQPEILTKQRFERLLIEVDFPTNVRVKIVPAFQTTRTIEESASEESSSVVTPGLSSPTTVIHIYDREKRVQSQAVQSQADASAFPPFKMTLLRKQPQETVSTVKEVSPRTIEESASVVTPGLSSPTTVIHVCDREKRVQSQAGASPDFAPLEVMLLNQPQETVSTVQEVSPPDHHAQSNFLLDDTQEHGYAFLQMKMMVDHVLSTVNCLGFNCSPRCA